MSNAIEPQVGTLRPLFWAHVSTNSDGQPGVLHSYTLDPRASDEDSDGADSSILTTDNRSGRRPSSSISSTSSTFSTESASSSQASCETGHSIRVKIRRVPQKRKPVLRRCCSPVTESLREIRQRQSEEDLRLLYEAQTLAYLNDAIHF